MRAFGVVMPCSRRRRRRACAKLPKRPKLLPYMTTVSNCPSFGLMRLKGSSFTFLTPRALQTFSASGEVSMPVTSNPRDWRWSATRPAPQPTSNTRPRASAMASFSYVGQSACSAK